MKKTIQELFNEAKNKCEKIYNDPARQWISFRLDLPGYKDYALELVARPGSPYKGYILINYGIGKVMAFDSHGKIIYSACED